MQSKTLLDAKVAFMSSVKKSSQKPPHFLSQDQEEPDTPQRPQRLFNGAGQEETGQKAKLATASTNPRSKGSEGTKKPSPAGTSMNQPVSSEGTKEPSPGASKKTAGYFSVDYWFLPWSRSSSPKSAPEPEPEPQPKEEEKGEKKKEEQEPDSPSGNESPSSTESGGEEEQNQQLQQGYYAAAYQDHENYQMPVVGHQFGCFPNVFCPPKDGLMIAPVQQQQAHPGFQQGGFSLGAGFQGQPGPQFFGGGFQGQPGPQFFGGGFQSQPTPPLGYPGQQPGGQQPGPQFQQGVDSENVASPSDSSGESSGGGGGGGTPSSTSSEDLSPASKKKAERDHRDYLKAMGKAVMTPGAKMPTFFNHKNKSSTSLAQPKKPVEEQFQVGNRVKITKGANKNKTGTFAGLTKNSACYQVKLDKNGKIVNVQKSSVEKWQG